MKPNKKTTKAMKEARKLSIPVAYKDDLEFYTPEQYHSFDEDLQEDLIPLYVRPQQDEIEALRKELTDEVIEQVRVAIMGAAYWCADENMPEAYNAVKVCCGQVLGILVKAQEK